MIRLVLGLWLAASAWGDQFIYKPPQGGETLTCDQTISTGANLGTTVSGAANNTVICLNTGSWGTRQLFDIARSGFVTITTAVGATVTINFEIGNSDFIRVNGVNGTLNLAGGLINSCSTNIEFLHATMVPDTSGMYFDASVCPGTTHNYLVDDVDFTDVGQANYEGRLNCRDCNGVIVRYSTFANTGTEPSDGIQLQCCTQNFTIGPGNLFSGIVESDCGAVHCDAVQILTSGTITITSNYFTGGDTYIMSPDGCNDVLVEKNIFKATGSYPMQFGTCADLIFRHNTLYNSGIAIDSKVGEPASTNALMENNILVGGSDIKTEGGNGCTSCTFRYNLFPTTGAEEGRGTNNIIGSPTFDGGSLPTTWAGWHLSNGSVGENAGNDGQDVGTLYYGP